MGFEEDGVYRDEGGEPVTELDDMPSDNREGSVESEDLDWRRVERTPTPVHDSGSGDEIAKPRRRLVKQSFKADKTPDMDCGHDEEEEEAGSLEGDSGRVKPLSNKRVYGAKDGRSGKRRRQRKHADDGVDDPDMKEMWDAVAGEDTESGNNGGDVGASGDDNAPPQANKIPEEEDDEINMLFGKKKRKVEMPPADIAMFVEKVMAELEIAAEEDAELNRQSKPAVNKLMKLPLLTQVLSKKQFQLVFLGHGVLGALKTWLEPLPDGSLPNISIRTAILEILIDYPLDLEQYDRKEELRNSGLGKVIMFLSKSDEETNANKKLAQKLVEKWSRSIFNKSARYEDSRSHVEERVPDRRPSKKPASRPAARMEFIRDDDDELDLKGVPERTKTRQPMQRAIRPEEMPMDFVLRPPSKIAPAEVKPVNQWRLRMSKRLQVLKTPKNKKLKPISYFHL